jgi:sigma-B regulation protein RsbU (phosphoserine phosphatase)
MPYLVIENGSGSPRVLNLESGVQLIGRDGVCELVLDDLKASRRHARIMRREDGSYFIEDLGSKNGTLVNGRPIRERRLVPGDHVEIGATVLVFRDAEATTAGTSYTIRETGTATERASVVGSQERLQLSQKRLEMLSDLTERLVRLQNRAELLEEVMDICFETLRFERGLIALKTGPEQPREEPIVRNLREDATGQLTISRSILNRALEQGERTIINDSAVELLDPTVSIAAHHIRSAMCVPLEYRGEILGVIYGDRVSSTTQYEREDVDFLAALARQASIGLTNARLLEEHSRMVQLENELSLARQIQTELFPPDFGQRGGLHIRAFNEPGHQVSGDYYDVVAMSDGRTAVVIADVSGKGVSAALLMANLQAAVRVTLPQADDLSAAVNRWNHLVYDNTDAGKFVTLLLVVVDAKARSLEIVNAGHLAPYLLRAGGNVELLADEPQLPLGIEHDEVHTVRRRDLGPEAFSLFMCTDGVPEAMNENLELFGDERLHDCLRKLDTLDPEALIDRARREVKRFSGNAQQTDDITMLAIHLPAR